MSKHLSFVKRYHLLASAINLIFCGLSSFYKIGTICYTTRVKYSDYIFSASQLARLKKRDFNMSSKATIRERDVSLKNTIRTDAT